MRLFGLLGLRFAIIFGLGLRCRQGDRCGGDKVLLFGLFLLFLDDLNLELICLEVAVAVNVDLQLMVTFHIDQFFSLVVEQVGGYLKGEMSVNSLHLAFGCTGVDFT